MLPTSREGFLLVVNPLWKFWKCPHRHTWKGNLPDSSQPNQLIVVVNCHLYPYGKLDSNLLYFCRGQGWLSTQSHTAQQTGDLPRPS